MAKKAKSSKSRKGARKAKQPQRKRVVQVTRAPVAIARTIRASQPKYTNVRSGVIVKHREMMTTLTTTNPTVTTGGVRYWSFTINPGRPVFQWLKGQARSWERYKFHKLSISYEPRVPTSTVGSVFYAVEYDVTDPIPGSVEEFMQNHTAKQSAVWKSFSLDIPCRDLHPQGKEFYIYTGSSSVTPTNQDVCNVLVACDQTVDTLGYLYVDYVVELRIQQPAPPLGSASASVSNFTGGTYVPTSADPTGYPKDTKIGTVQGTANTPVPSTGFTYSGGVSDITFGATGTASPAVVQASEALKSEYANASQKITPQFTKVIPNTTIPSDEVILAPNVTEGPSIATTVAVKETNSVGTLQHLGMKLNLSEWVNVDWISRFLLPIDWRGAFASGEFNFYDAVLTVVDSLGNGTDYVYKNIALGGGAHAGNMSNEKLNGTVTISVEPEVTLTTGPIQFANIVALGCRLWPLFAYAGSKFFFRLVRRNTAPAPPAILNPSTFTVLADAYAQTDVVAIADSVYNQMFVSRSTLSDNTALMVVST